ncbi:UvrD/REP helicase [Paraglaciecola sp. T6c]|uniref:UvrD-helicase domain-containing protein n=1 Tax=Pseudoalteromonas atlantica (strain T6c / ATCC BAA-1087) TaxID=3042615 RepID=UPI00005C6FA8|nr:UvrD-helicase domain-containing protein [Paraglaciecola sp. T6c]ABG40786.1 UvrD/REP helicase [Paraglaciecola sp. T6c]
MHSNSLPPSADNPPHYAITPPSARDQNPEEARFISLSWFGRIFSPLQVDLKFDESGVYFPEGARLSKELKSLLGANHIGSGEKKSVTFLSWQHFDIPPAFEWRWLGATMIFQVNALAHELHFLGYRSSQFQAGQIQAEWGNYHQSRLLQLVNNIENATQARYLRHSHVIAIKQRVALEYPRWHTWAQNAPLDSTVKEAVIKLKAMHQWEQADIAAIREGYIQKQLHLHADFFQRVESNPLTDKQRRACIIDDDNNLLLAGAGTGKTSVMVGRAGYLLTSGQAKPDDILLLAYGQKAATEIDERIKHKLDGQSIKASTFHSLGLYIITSVEGKKPTLSPWVNDEQKKNKWVLASLENQLQNVSYQKQVIEYLSNYYYQSMSPFDFDALSDYSRYLNENNVRTLKGEPVNCFGHLHIANWLYRNGIEYRYQAKYAFDVENKHIGGNRADFYLPHADVYIEYYVLDDEGNTPSYTDNNRYQAMMENKRQLYSYHGSRCIELFYYQYVNGKLNSILKRSANKLQVKNVPLLNEKMLNTLQKSNYLSELAILFCQLIGLYKSAISSKFSVKAVLADITSKGKAIDSQQARIAFTLLRPIFQHYQKHLSQHAYIDFEDMISKAITYVEKGHFTAPWRYIMVDEFQDISEPRARLVRSLRDSTRSVSALPRKNESVPSSREVLPRKQSQSASIFCVGDDWQAIYRFSGADVSLTTQFTQYFGHSIENVLDQTFRFNNRIGDVATQFISRNPAQITKNIRSLVKVADPRIRVLYSDTRLNSETQSSNTEKLLHQALATLAGKVDEISEQHNKRGKTEKIRPTQSSKKDTLRQCSKPTVYILARFWFQLPDREGLEALNKQYTKLHIKCLSFHAAKGKEADYAIITGMTAGKHGFPADKVTSPVVEALLPKQETFTYAEERRLFYVALTRAKHHVYVLADMTQASAFVTELMNGTYDVELTLCNEN